MHRVNSNFFELEVQIQRFKNPIYWKTVNGFKFKTGFLDLHFKNKQRQRTTCIKREVLLFPPAFTNTFLASSKKK